MARATDTWSRVGWPVLAAMLALLTCGGAAAQTLTRAGISATEVGSDTIVVSGYRAAGDLGAGAVYSSVGATADGLEAVRDARGTWFNLTPSHEVDVGWFGAYADDGAHKLTAADIAANPQWRGTYVVGDTWDTVATREALYAAFAGGSTPGHVMWNSLAHDVTRNRTLYVPNGVYGVNEQLLLVGAFIDIEFQSRAARWDWQGSPAVSMLFTDAIAYAYIKDITLTSEQRAVYGQAAPLWDMDWNGAYGGLKTQQLTIVDALVRVSFNGRGVAISRSGGGAQGDTIVWVNPLFEGLAPDYCLALGGANALSVMIDGGDFQGCTHDAVQVGMGTVYLRGTSFQDQATYLGFTPVLSQFTTGGADVHTYGGQGDNSVNKIQDVRSESDVPVLCSPGTFCIVEDVENAAGSSLNWFASYPYPLGATVARVGTQGRTFMVVDDGGDGDWKAPAPAASKCEIDDPAASYVPGAWAGERLFLRFDNGATEHHVIASNTATTITLAPADCLKRSPTPGVLYHIGGITGATPPDWDRVQPGGSPQTWGTGQGFFTTAGSSDVRVGSEIYGHVDVGDYIVVPNADRVGQISQTPAAYIARVLAKSGGDMLHVDKKAAAGVSGAYGYWGAPLSDNQIRYIDLDFNALTGAQSVQSSSNPQGRTLRLGRIADYHNPRADWRRPGEAAPSGSENPTVNQVRGATVSVLAAALPTTPVVDLASALANADDLVLIARADTRLDAPAPTPGVAREITLQITAAGAPHAITFGANFKSAGPLSTGGVAGASFVVRFVSDGVSWNEASRSGPNLPSK